MRKNINESLNPAGIYVLTFTFALLLAGCSGSEVKPQASPTSAVSSTSEKVPSVGTGVPAIQSTTAVAGASAVDIDKQEAARRKEDFERDQIKMKNEQDFKASEAEKDRRMKQTEMMASMIPVLAMTSLFTQLSDKIERPSALSKSPLCLKNGTSTYKSILADAKSIFEKADVGTGVKSDAVAPSKATKDVSEKSVMDSSIKPNPDSSGTGMIDKFAKGAGIKLPSSESKKL